MSNIFYTDKSGRVRTFTPQNQIEYQIIDFNEDNKVNHQTPQTPYIYQQPYPYNKVTLCIFFIVMLGMVLTGCR